MTHGVSHHLLLKRSSKFVLFCFRFNVSLLHCTRLVTRGRLSHASSPLHAAADWPFEVLLGFLVGIHLLKDSALESRPRTVKYEV